MSEVPAPFYLAISVNVQLLQQIQDKQVSFSSHNIILIILLDTLSVIALIMLYMHLMLLPVASEFRDI
jgi:hypothetical protein